MKLVCSIGIALGLVTGCSNRLDWWPSGDGGAGHEGGASASVGGGGGGSVCADSLDQQDRCTLHGACGRCVVAKAGVKESLGLWRIGGPDQDFSCPAGAPHAGSVLYGDLPQAAPAVCPLCECGPAKCALPPEVVASPGSCVENEPGVLYSSGVWEEEVCTTEGAIPGIKAACGDWCESLTFPPAIVEPCAPITVGAPVLPSWQPGLVARECIVEPLTREDCPKAGQACIPPAPGFSVCVLREGHEAAFACEAPYPRRLELFEGADDLRGCEPCDCGDPEGAACTALVHVYSDGACGGPNPLDVLGALFVDDQPNCVDIPPGSPVGSKVAHFTVADAGACVTMGGGAIGAIEPVGAWTLCCEPEAIPTE